MAAALKKILETKYIFVKKKRKKRNIGSAWLALRYPVVKMSSDYSGKNVMNLY